MRPFFTPAGVLALRGVMRLRPLLAFDFDGTLAPIVARPDDAHVPEPVSRCLRELAATLPTAVITGRSVADVRPRLGFEPAYIVGNHGAEQTSGGAPLAAARALDFLRERIAACGKRLAAAGVSVEDKRYSLALHYRLAADAAAARACIDALLLGIEPSLTRFGGKFVVNVVAAGVPDKADALAGLVERSAAGAALFVGDDVNDEAVFRRAVPPWLTIRIGSDDLSSQAMYFLDSDAELVTVLRQTAALCAAS